MSPEDVYDSEMRKKRLIDDAQVEALLSGSDSGTGLESFVDGVRSTFVGELGPTMDPRVAAAVRALSKSKQAVSFAGYGHRRSIARMTAFLSGLAAKFGAMSIGAKAALAAAVATSAVSGAAVVANAPNDSLELITPVTTTIEIEAATTTLPEVDTSLGDDDDSSDSSFSSDMSADESGMDASADGANTLEGAPDQVLEVLAVHCGIVDGDIPEGVEFDWSWDTSEDLDDVDESLDLSCEWIDADGCEVEVDFSTDSSQDTDDADESSDVSIESSCDDDDQSSDDVDSDDMDSDDDESSDDMESDDMDSDDEESAEDAAREADHESVEDDDESIEVDDEL